MEFTLTSPAFNDGEKIPRKYTCDGKNASPPLAWSQVPKGTETFAIIFDDPDAPSKTWVHWVLYNIPGNEHKLDEQIPPSEILANGALHGTNDFGKRAYRGPCPPIGPHRYVIKLYAVNTELDMGLGATKEELLDAMKGHILGKAELTGIYTRPK